MDPQLQKQLGEAAAILGPVAAIIGGLAAAGGLAMILGTGQGSLEFMSSDA